MGIFVMKLTIFQKKKNPDLDLNKISIGTYRQPVREQPAETANVQEAAILSLGEYSSIYTLPGRLLLILLSRGK